MLFSKDAEGNVLRLIKRDDFKKEITVSQCFYTLIRNIEKYLQKAKVTYMYMRISL